MASADASRRSILSRLRRILWVALLTAVVLTIVPVVCLRWVPPPTSAYMLERRAADFWRGNPQRVIRYRWIGWESISPQMRLAVVAAEDQKFPHHWGFDLDSIADAVQHEGPRGRLRGASTITQQVARNLFLWPGCSYVRKGLEAYFTVLLELLWPKRRILEVYLNVAEFGDGAYGVRAAAQTFFGKRPSELQAQDAALLAAVLPNPARLHVRNPSAYVRERAGWIEEQMAQLGPAYLQSL
ncbi:MAG: monofunctional biosynthetic peptidoglycan transglycosylase [Candidatus Methylomirabilales bacterium]